MSWLRKHDHDLAIDGFSPIPLQIVSNEEYLPLPPTAEQQRVALRLRELSTRHAKKLGLSRRAFLGTSCGMATAFLAMNTVFGRFFAVDPAEAWQASARQPSKEFVFDIQTHHVRTGLTTGGFLRYREMAKQWDRGIGTPAKFPDVYLANYIKEVFLDSDTAVAVISGVPATTDRLNFLPVDQMAETREVINKLAASRRMVCHGLIAPPLGKRDLDEMARQVSDLKVEAWKGYTGGMQGGGRHVWSVDDEKVGYPMLEQARKLGVKNVCLHKGLPFPGTTAEDWHPRDIAKAARDFPDINFIVYHAGLKDVREAMGVNLSRAPARIDWVSDLCEMRAKDPKLTNVYAELGSTFGLTAITAPALCAHLLGMLIRDLGADHVLWGTDSIWWGTPQWQIEAFRRLTMPESLMKTFGYAPLTPDVKTKILGLNAAKVYGIDPNALVNPVPNDFVSKLRAAYREDGARPSLTQYGWVAGMPHAGR
jgi:hypothetical protein